MLKLIRFLITGSWHEHKWEIIKETPVQNFDGITRQPTGKFTRYTMQCKGCGDIKFIESEI